MNLTSELKNFALDLGYSHVGVTTADDFAEYRAELESRGDLYDFYREDPRNPVQNCSPRSLHPWAHSIIVLVYDYMQKRFPEALGDKIGRAYLARCYNPPAHRINGARYELIQAYMQKRGLKTHPGTLLPARWAGARAGVTTFGRNNFAYAKGSGSFIIVSSILTDAVLEYDSPTLENTCPDGCRACMDACPTKAIYEPFKLNPRKCIAFNTFRTTAATGCGVTDYIPREIRPLMEQWIHGCDACQLACPRNAARLKTKLPKDNFLEDMDAHFDLRGMLAMPPEYFERWIEPTMYNYLKEKHFFQRNAAVAMGNSGDDSYIPDLVEAMENPTPTVRAHAAWAMGRLGGSRSKAILEEYAARERDPTVLQEITWACEQL
ncbi:HEAT repeat domain-containing protein [Desulfovibrio sp. OttesenSCG-928-F07]|nr:HEAT repeat domain-containing protein [Desulfovibrio sp. OttesenSCG-928-F07]